jgi:hypothetical protein
MRFKFSHLHTVIWCLMLRIHSERYCLCIRFRYTLKQNIPLLHLVHPRLSNLVCISITYGINFIDICGFLYRLLISSVGDRHRLMTIRIRIRLSISVPIQIRILPQVLHKMEENNLFKCTKRWHSTDYTRLFCLSHYSSASKV